MERPDWDATWMTIAETVGRRSRCIRAQVGAVIVTRDNRVAAISYNGQPAARFVHGLCTNWCPRARGETSLTADYSACGTVHAEANGLVRADFTDIKGGTIYVSRSMCINCAKLVGTSGLTRVVHRVTADDAHRDPDAVEAFLQDMNIKVTRVSS